MCGRMGGVCAWPDGVMCECVCRMGCVCGRMVVCVTGWVGGVCVCVCGRMGVCVCGRMVCVCVCVCVGGVCVPDGCVCVCGRMGGVCVCVCVWPDG